MSATLTVTELARLVRDYRAAQEAFFRTRAPGDLERSLVLERKVDLAVAMALPPQPPPQPGLFEEEASP